MLIGFIDIEKAYDNVDRDKLWQKLSALGVNKIFITILQSMYHNNQRKVHLPRCSTKWFSNKKGVRQGCPLSPLLFALFINHISPALNTNTIGINIADTQMTHLLYADDIALVASSAQDMQKQLQVLNTSLNSSGLNINVKKSKIMRIGNSTPHMSTSSCTWPVYGGNDTRQGEIAETLHYKYLGLIFQNSLLFPQHTAQSLSTTKQRAAAVRSHATYSLDRYSTAMAMWQMSILPATLNGAEIIPYSDSWIKTAESLQAGVLKWLVGASRSASASTITGMFNWISVQTQIDMKKLAYWQRVIRMHKKRWPKIYLKAMQEAQPGQQYQWYTDIQELQLKYSIVVTTFTERARWQQHLRSSIQDAHWRRWHEDIHTKQHLKFMVPVIGDQNCFRYVQGERAKLAIQIRLADIWAIAHTMKMPYCTRCGTATQEWIPHILWHCNTQQLAAVRAPLLATAKELGTTEDDSTKIILNSTASHTIQQIGILVKTWQSMPLVTSNPSGVQKQ